VQLNPAVPAGTVTTVLGWSAETGIATATVLFEI